MFNGKAVSVKDQLTLIASQMQSVNFNTERNFFVLNVEQTIRDPGLTHGPGRMSKSRLSHLIKSLLTQLKNNYAVVGMIYTNKAFWDDFVHTPDVDLSHHGLWIARYLNLPGHVMDERLRELFQNKHLPPPATGFNSIAFWQFSDKERIEGISGDVSCSIAVPEEHYKWLAHHGRKK